MFVHPQNKNTNIHIHLHGRYVFQKEHFSLFQIGRRRVSEIQLPRALGGTGVPSFTQSGSMVSQCLYNSYVG